MTDVSGNPEEERRADFYYQPWTQEAVCRYFYGKVMNSWHNIYIWMEIMGLHYGFTSDHMHIAVIEARLASRGVAA